MRWVYFFECVILKIVPKAGMVFTVCGRKSTAEKQKSKDKIDQWQRRKAETTILMCLSGGYLELVSVFKEESRNLIMLGAHM
jgi:hypothetical protein